MFGFFFHKSNKKKIRIAFFFLIFFWLQASALHQKTTGNMDPPDHNAPAAASDGDADDGGSDHRPLPPERARGSQTPPSTAPNSADGNSLSGEAEARPPPSVPRRLGTAQEGVPDSPPVLARRRGRRGRRRRKPRNNRDRSAGTSRFVSGSHLTIGRSVSGGIPIRTSRSTNFLSDLVREYARTTGDSDLVTRLIGRYTPGVGGGSSLGGSSDRLNLLGFASSAGGSSERNSALGTSDGSLGRRVSRSRSRGRLHGRSRGHSRDASSEHSASVTTSLRTDDARPLFTTSVAVEAGRGGFGGGASFSSGSSGSGGWERMASFGGGDSGSATDPDSLPLDRPPRRHAGRLFLGHGTATTGATDEPGLRLRGSASDGAGREPGVAWGGDAGDGTTNGVGRNDGAASGEVSGAGSDADLELALEALSFALPDISTQEVLRWVSGGGAQGCWSNERDSSAACI